MAENPDLIELLRALNEENAEYLIVGGYAVMKYTEPRFTKDLDVWIGRTPENAARVYRALAQFGAPLQKDELSPADFATEDMTYQIGVDPVRIDILTRITGVKFAQAWEKKIAGTLFGVPVNFISLADLIVNKRAAGRSTDAEQLQHLVTEMKKKSS